MQTAKIVYTIIGLILIVVGFLTYSYDIQITLFFFFIAGLCMYIAFGKGRIPKPYESYAAMDKTRIDLDTLPPLRRQYVVEQKIGTLSIIQFLQTIITGMFFLYMYNSSFELSTFFDTSIGYTFVLTMISGLISGYYLKKLQKLGLVFAFIVMGLGTFLILLYYLQGGEFHIAAFWLVVSSYVALGSFVYRKYLK